MKTINESVFPDEEMTRYGFMSHMEAYIKQLLQNPTKAQPDEYLKKHGIDGKKALEFLLKRTDQSNPDSAILKRKERISPEELSEEDINNGVIPKDRFHIKYSLPRKNYYQKLRNRYIEAFESNIIEGCPINECDGGTMGDMGGATSCDSSNGQFIQPLTKTPIKRKTIYMSEAQKEYLRKALNEDSPVVMNTMAGDFGYDANALKAKGDPAMNHKDMMKKSWNGGEKNE